LESGDKMATIAEQLKLIEKHIQLKIQDAMQKEVAETVRKTMQDHIQKDVYNTYIPYSKGGVTPHYKRTYKLIADNTIRSKMINNNTLQVTNEREEDGIDIVKVIEYGKGYTWGYTRDLDEEIGARPFIKNTREDLRINKQHVRALKLGLIRNGVKVV